jgi:predicted glycosyltransferase/peptidoglycan/xylan/chitin deacetylase (PgdA/CDA1 family)
MSRKAHGTTAGNDGVGALRIWIDIENPPQVQYLLPFHAVFQEANADVLVTVRDYGFALDLVEQSGVPFEAVGTSLGKSTLQKVRGTVRRSSDLTSLLADERLPDAVLGASRASALTARRLGIPSFVILDYEHAHVAIYRFTRTGILYPSVVEPGVLTRRGISPSQMMPFSGIKEDITFAGLDVDAIEPHVFPNVEPGARLVLFRPPAEESHYFDPESRRISLQALDYLSQQDDVVVVYSPRMSWQAAYLERQRWKNPPILLSSPVAFLPLLKAVDAVISSGGTMLREAAYLGIPAYSIFRSEIGAVDRYLERLGRLAIVESPEDFGRLGEANGRKPLLRSNPSLLEELAAAILARVGAPATGRQRGRMRPRPWVPARAPQAASQAPARRERVLFAASRGVQLLDCFRIPYRVDRPSGNGNGRPSPLARLARASGDGPELRWAPAEADLSHRGRPAASYTLGGSPIFCRVVRDEEASTLLRPTDRTWTRAEPILDERGAHAASIWRADDGSVFLPFDLDEAISAFWSEGYARLDDERLSRRANRLAQHAYYTVRPVIPRAVQLAFRRRFISIQSRASFPGWPVETALHDLYSFLLAELEAVAGEPVPRIAPWPGGHTWSAVLTHDVETQTGYDRIQRMLAVERELGYRSAWYFVPERDYRVEEPLVDELAADGFEVGVHGLRHDGRDLSPRSFPERLPAIRRYAERWGAIGFRSPATHRDWGRMSLLNFDYDSSYSDTAVYEPQAGGCCAWLPFFIGTVLELPITMPQDHTLFALLRHEDETAWLEKAAFLRERGGMALLLTHPDYLGENGTLPAYRRYLEWLGHDESAWRALPRDVSEWWRRRAASAIERDEDGWRVVGPAAADARVETGPLP